ncbi:MAG: carboxypeptidase regulatory-like domain-containing protein [Sphingomonadales bacterium]|nr:carboxypeptidase regulatory-like domain-containing protein [Sphingomonadales bacterium]
MRSKVFATSIVAAFTLASSPAIAREGAAISVHVVDADTGAPIASAALVVERPDSDQPAAIAVTNKDGRGVVGALAEGSYRLSIAAPGYDSAARDAPCRRDDNSARPRTHRPSPVRAGDCRDRPAHAGRIAPAGREQLPDRE